MQTDNNFEREVIDGSNDCQIKESKDTSDGEGGASITDGVRSRLRRLGALYSG